MSAEGDEVLVFYPTTKLPYVLGALSFAMGVAAAISHVTRSSNDFDVVAPSLAVFFIGVGIIIIGLRLADFPRLRMEGNCLTLEPGYGKPLKPFDLAQYGRAIAFPMRLGTLWTTHIGFPTRREEIALHVSGNSELIDRFSVAQAIGVTAIVGLSARKAQDMADVINANRPSKAHPTMEYSEISSISRSALDKRWGIKLVYVAMCACFLLYYAIKFVTS
jgi:hypothetical protein